MNLQLVDTVTATARHTYSVSVNGTVVQSSTVTVAFPISLTAITVPYGARVVATIDGVTKYDATITDESGCNGVG